MTEVKPFIKCVDYWPGEVPEAKLAAYQGMIETGQIQKHHVVCNRKTGATMIEYYSTAPHEWILQELRKMAEGGGAKR